jgi:hypothetical protein
MKKVTYHLTEPQIQKLQQESVKSGLAVAEIIRRAIDHYLHLLRDEHDKNRS